MKIISSFRDYYDGLQNHEEPTFIRENKWFEVVRPHCNYWVEPSVFYYVLCVGQLRFNLYGWNNHYYVDPTELENKIKSTIPKRRYALILTMRKNIVKPPKMINQQVNQENPIELYQLADKTYTDIKLQLRAINPSLKDMGLTNLAKVETIFQEIEMFVSNQTIPDKPLPIIDDVTLAESKGFNKYSFRKDKSE